MTVGSTAPPNCAYSFTWHGVVPPSHCPHCGRCLGCGGPWVYPMPVAPAPKTWPAAPRPYYPGPTWYTFPVVSTNEVPNNGTVVITTGE